VEILGSLRRLNDASQESASGKLEIALALGADCGRVTVDS
jgi:hypothetical protein